MPNKVCTMLDGPRGVAELPGDCPALLLPNAGGAGYYVFQLDKDGWIAAVRDFAVLSEGEQIAALYSADAGFRAGQLEPKTLIDIIEAGAQSSQLDVQRTSITIARGLEAALPDSGRDEYRAWVRHVGNRLGEPAITERSTGAERALAKEFIKLAALGGKSPKHRAELLGDALSLLGIGPSARQVANDIREIALVVAVEDGAPKAYTKLLEQAKVSTDSRFLREALVALANARRPEDQHAFIQAVNSGAFSATEVANTLLWRLGEYRDAGTFAWSAGKATFAWLLERVPQGSRQSTPFFAAGLCSAADQADLNAFFAANGAKVPGHERSLAQTNEVIGRCAALRNTRGPDLVKVLAAARN
jgi:alanyl aminopeptidase